MDTQIRITMREACKIAEKWVFPVTESDKQILMNFLTGTETAFNSLLIKYIELLKPYMKILGLVNNNPRESDCLASGIVFFYGALFYIMHFPNWGNYIRDIFLYDLLYILVDHYLDDNNVDSQIKTVAISQMACIIMNPSSHTDMTLIDPLLKTVAIVYEELITRCPLAKDPIIKLFQAEITGLSIQNNNNLSRDSYYNIAMQKGGYTVQVLQALVGNTDPKITKASYELGEIVQLLDDILDNFSDISNRIHTIATHDLKHQGNLDNLWIDLMMKIDRIDNRFNIFKIFYSIFAVYIPDRCKECFSEQLRCQTNKLNLFDYNYGCDASLLLVRSIMDEIYAMKLINNLST